MKNIEPIYKRNANYYGIDGEMYRIKQCAVTNEEYRVKVDRDAIARWMNGELIQKAMPDLSLEQREFLISGLTPAEFKELYNYEEE